jgi:hypothetical protein
MNPIALITTWAGALVPTFLFSRLTLLLVKRDNRHRFFHLAFAHGLALLIGMLLVGFGTHDNSPLSLVEYIFGPGLITGLYYNAVPQAFWLFSEYVVRSYRARRERLERIMAMVEAKTAEAKASAPSEGA